MNKPQKPTTTDTSTAAAGATGAASANESNPAASSGPAKDQPAKGGAADLLGQVPQSVKDASQAAMTKINKLSTTQKVVGGALLVAGVGYLASTRKKKSKKGQSGTLHELLYFVNDRIEGYQRAVRESQDPKLQGYYKQLVNQSQQFAGKLNQHLRRQDGSQEQGTTLKGKLYRAWMDTKAAVTGFDEAAILNSNIYGEEWALKAYEEALDDQTLTGALRVEVERQYTQSQNTYRELQKMAAKQ